MAQTKTLFIINGTHKSLHQIIDKIKSKFQNEKARIEITEYSGHGIKIAKKQASKYDFIIAVGGDGTINEVVNGVLESGESPTLGVLPAGTANDFSKSIDGPKDIDDIYHSIMYNKSSKIYVGKGTFTDLYNVPATRYFVNIADVGIGGEVARLVNNDDSNLSSNLKFFKNTIKGFVTYKKTELIYIADIKNDKKKSMSIVVAKGKYFGSGLGVAPNANPKGKKLAIVVIGDISLIDYFTKLKSLLKAEKIKHKEVDYFDTHKIKIKSETPSPIDMDGELVGYTPVIFESNATPVQWLTN